MPVTNCEEMGSSILCEVRQCQKGVLIYFARVWRLVAGLCCKGKLGDTIVELCAWVLLGSGFLGYWCPQYILAVLGRIVCNLIFRYRASAILRSCLLMRHYLSLVLAHLDICGDLLYCLDSWKRSVFNRNAISVEFVRCIWPVMFSWFLLRLLYNSYGLLLINLRMYRANSTFPKRLLHSVAFIWRWWFLGWW